MARKQKKTLAMKALDAQNVSYEVIEFPSDVHSAIGVAEHTGVSPEQVYKTLVVLNDAPGDKPNLIMVAADQEIDLKRTAKALGIKKVRMASHNEAENLTGLQVGGISALALLNRRFNIYVDEPAILLEEILVSAGQRGLDVRLSIDDLMSVTGAEWLDATGSA